MGAQAAPAERLLGPQRGLLGEVDGVDDLRLSIEASLRGRAQGEREDLRGEVGSRLALVDAAGGEQAEGERACPLVAAPAALVPVAVDLKNEADAGASGRRHVAGHAAAFLRAL